MMWKPPSLSYCQFVQLIKRFGQVKFNQRFSTAVPLHPHKPKGHVERVQAFEDFRKIQVIAGNGGNGCLTFSSLPCKEFAGPDGGDGGNGGHVIFIATPSRKSLNHLDHIIKGKDGNQGQIKNCHGANAKHKEIEVPVGTLFYTEEGELLTELDRAGDYYIGARGGSGGKGNRFFLSNEHRAPAKAEKGALGESRILLVELRIMANVGLIGFPNAGKSTLLRSISRARPKVAAYPFTTLNPHIGMVQFEDYKQVSVADIPGLVSGAHLDKGLGISFLRHIERCSCLLYVIDLSEDKPWEQLDALKYELEQYRKGLSQRPHSVIGNKMDLNVANENLKLLCEKTNLPVIPISAKKRIGTVELMSHLRLMCEQVDKKV